MSLNQLRWSRIWHLLLIVRLFEALAEGAVFEVVDVEIGRADEREQHVAGMEEKILDLAGRKWRACQKKHLLMN
jgi:hypothetical protein